MASKQVPRSLYPDKEKFLSKEDIKETERLLEILKYSQSRVESHYEEWVEQREKSIKSIGCLEKKLENLHQACNAAHGVGSAMEIVGGLAMVAGTILTACGHKNVGEFLTEKVSTVSTVTGVATTITSAVAETGLTVKTINEAKMVLVKDQEYTQLLMENLKNSKEIDSRFRRIFNCSVLSNIFLHVVRLVQEGILLLQASYVDISKLMVVLKTKLSKCTDISDMVAMSETILQNVCTTMKKIMTNPEARKSVQNICKIIQQSPLAVECIKMTLRISFQICDVCKVDVFTGLLGLGLIQTTAGAMATKCLLGTVQIAINVLSVISAVEEAQEGTSQYSKMLKEVKQALIAELNTVRKNYPKVL